MKPFNIVIAEGNEKYRRDLVEFLETNYYCTVTGQAHDSESFLKLGTLIKKADVILIDVLLFKNSGYQLAQRIAIQYPQSKIITLVIPENYRYLANLMGLNVREIIYKSSLYTDIIPALERVLEGKTVIRNCSVSNRNSLVFY